MKKINFLSLFFLSLICHSCHRNPIERNTIVFKNKVEEVQDSLLNMKMLLAKFPYGTAFVSNYYFDDQTLFINNNKIGNVKEIRLDTIQAFKEMNISERRNFLVLAKYLGENYLKSAYFDRRLGLWVFEYRKIEDITFNDYRSVVVADKAQLFNVRSSEQILDNKNKIYLLAPKDAKIR